MVYINKINSSLINHLYKVLDYYKDINTSNQINTCTMNGFQTSNVMQYIDENLLRAELVSHITKYLSDYYGNNVSCSYYIDHIHIIDYNPGGLQSRHDHRRTEDHSFIIYMNDSDGKTRIFVDEPLDIESEQGKIVIFNAAYFHEGLPCSDRRVVAVGAIRFSHKEWNDVRFINK